MKLLRLVSTFLLCKVADGLAGRSLQRVCLTGKSVSALEPVTLQQQRRSPHRRFEKLAGPGRFAFTPTALRTVSKSKDVEKEDEAELDLDFNITSVIDVLFRDVAGCIGIAVVLARVFRIPNCGLGAGFCLNWGVLMQGVVWMLPLGGAALTVSLAGNRVPALQDVGIAMQQMALVLLGGRFRPALASVIAPLVSSMVALSEEMLFRGILQYEIGRRFLLSPKLSILVTSIVFGLLHMYTRVYSALAGMASIYFGWLYQLYGNLAVPVVVHAGINTLLFFLMHRSVSKLSKEEQEMLYLWENTQECEQVDDNAEVTNTVDDID